MKVFRIVFLCIMVQLGLSCAQKENQMPSSSNLASDPIAIPTKSSGTSSKEKLIAEKSAAIRRDIQLKKEELTRKRQDLGQSIKEEEAIKENVAELQREAAGTVAERVSIDTSSDQAVYGSVVEQRRAEQLAQQKRQQLLAEAERQKTALSEVEEEIKLVKLEIDAIVKTINDLNQALTDLSLGKKA